MQRVYNKDNGKVAVASAIFIGLGFDEPRETVIEAYQQRIYFPMRPEDENVLRFLENRDCQVQLRVGFEGQVWAMPLYMFKNVFKIED